MWNVEVINIHYDQNIMDYYLSNFNKKTTRLQVANPFKKLHWNNENNFYFEDSWNYWKLYNSRN